MSKTEAAVFGMIITKVPFLFKSFCALFDLGATHSYLSIHAALNYLWGKKKKRKEKQSKQKHERVNYGSSLPNKQVTECLVPCKHVSIEVAEHDFLGNLNQFDISEFNIVVGMS